MYSQKDKTKFRKSKQWLDLRKSVRETQKLDPITEKPLSKTYNLHHGDLSPENYSNISDLSKFIGLNSQSHTLVHFLYGDDKKRKDWRKMIKNLIKILEWMDNLNDINTYIHED